MRSGRLLPTNTHTHTTVLQPFFRFIRMSRCQKKSSGLCGAREDNRRRHTNNPAGHHSMQTNQQPTSITPHFYAGCPSYHNPPNLSWVGTGTKYACLRTQQHITNFCLKLEAKNNATFIVWEHTMHTCVLIGDASVD